MTVREFIEWLKTQDQDATVQVVQHKSSGGTNSYYMQGGEAQVVDFNQDNPDLFEYTDFRSNQFVKPDAPYYNQRYLLIGEHNG